ncbi:MULTISPECIES: hypothetical protein [unclassified Modicisalibacter]|uniref:hypothetical protein n=1 Tax=unclassified Modicisalibacter TaxID=2679913 RepID=UPI001CC9A9F5|nr:MULTISPECIES: hypothetical protein [unclassified Modicisalibacter]MBZ9559944.1 hypothetical protein [Modicisalibacter sp. R2A 31.J]MBZ9575852.1 hypothetical protein [Modicisalibacter sp. MOD 31.J]
MLHDVTIAISPGAREVHESRIRKTVEIIRSQSLSCAKCGTLAVPVFGTRNLYRCLNCARQATNAAHDIRASLTAVAVNSATKSTYYQKALVLLESQANRERLCQATGSASPTTDGPVTRTVSPR